MNEKNQIDPEQVISKTETTSNFDEQIFVRKFKDADGGVHQFRINERGYWMKKFDESRFKIIVEKNGKFICCSSDDERSMIDQFKLHVFQIFQNVEFYQMTIPDINSEMIRAVFYIKDDVIQTEFCSILHFYNKNQKS